MENPPKIPGFSQNFLLEFPGVPFGAPKGPPRGPQGRALARQGARPWRTKARPLRDLSRLETPRRALAHQGRNLVKTLPTLLEKFAFYHIICYVSSFFARKKKFARENFRRRTFFDIFSTFRLQILNNGCSKQKKFSNPFCLSAGAEDFRPITPKTLSRQLVFSKKF